MAVDAIDHQLKRLDHLQSIVQRLAGNSFLIKGWAITLASAILGFGLKDAASAPVTYLAIVPTLVFWGLDAYYLAAERHMRQLYNTAANALHAATYNAASNQLPDPRIAPDPVTPCCWICAVIAPATCIIYLALLIAVCAVGSGMFTKAANALIAV